MKKTFLRTVAFAAIVLGGPAIAADMPIKAPPPVAPVFVGYLEISGLAMTRGKAESSPLISGSASPGTGNVLNSDAFDYGWTGGSEVRAGARLLGSAWGFEIAGQWLNQFRELVRSTVPGARRRPLSDTRSCHDLRYCDRGLLRFRRDVGNLQS